MKTDPSYIRKIILKKLSVGLSAEEEKDLFAWMNESALNKDSVSVFLDPPALRDAVQQIYISKEKVWNNVKGQIESVPSIERKRNVFLISSLRRYRLTAAVAICILFISLFVYLKYDHHEANDLGKVNNGSVVTKDIEPPKGISATIALSDGTIVPLSEIKDRSIGAQGNAKIVVREDGTIAYDILHQNERSSIVLYNTIDNPEGSKVVQISLSDGTKVWLNSGSSIKYPTFFSGERREIEMTGEIYFEVEKHKMSSFYVNIGKRGVVQVLGTKFNVNSYEDEKSTDITLIEGSLKVKESKTQSDIVLRPYQQAKLFADGDINLNTSPNIEKVMAWKNGTFDFGVASDINVIMKQIARWYGVDVQFSKKMNTLIGGEIPRDVNLSDVLKMLEMTGVLKFSIEGRTVFVKEPDNL